MNVENDGEVFFLLHAWKLKENSYWTNGEITMPNGHLNWKGHSEKWKRRNERGPIAKHVKLKITHTLNWRGEYKNIKIFDNSKKERLIDAQTITSSSIWQWSSTQLPNSQG